MAPYVLLNWKLIILNKEDKSSNSNKAIYLYLDY